VAPEAKPGPTPALSDQELLRLIQADLAASPFQGEGHRKVWARLRRQHQVQVSKNRVLRLMREHRLLSPHRVPSQEGEPHDGQITTAAPNVRWGTDGMRVLTVEQGWVWIFAVVEHWNAECLACHVAKLGDRFAALLPLLTALRLVFGSLVKDVARGLSLRLDHGCQYTSDYFVQQLHYYGLAASFAFVRQPQTNGVVERFFRTLREQAIHGRTFRNAEELRSAVADFVQKYNASWRLEKLNYRSPQEARQELTNSCGCTSLNAES
jgi:transposase InsO family protein